MIRAVVFSLESILLNTELVHLLLYKDLFGKFDVPFTGSVYTQYFSGVRFVTGLTAYLASIGKQDTFGKIISEKVRVDVSYIETVQANKDGLAFLQKVKPTCQIGVVSTDPEHVVQMILQRLKLQWSFGAIVSADTYRLDPPHPDMFDTARGRLSSALAETLVVSGFPNHIQAARVAHLHTLAVTRSQDVTLFGDSERHVITLDNVTLEGLGL